MGANAQTTVPDFVAETVLTAAKLDISAATGVPVFATTVTRDAAFGGVNKVLAEGQTCYLEDANVVQFYDGAAWATVGPAAAGGLVQVQAETAFTTVSSFNSNAGVFSATYSHYLILLSTTQALTITGMFWQGRTGGTTNSTANYNRQDNIFTTSTTSARSTGATSAQLQGNGGQASTSTIINVANPFATEKTLLTTTFYTVNFSGLSGGGFDLTTSFDAFTISATGNLITGTYTVYGYQK